MFRLFAAVLCFSVFVPRASALEDARLLRFPDIRNDLVTFVYAGDIWTVSAQGGEARRITSHEGLELFPKISPTGSGSPSQVNIRAADRFL